MEGSLSHGSGSHRRPSAAAVGNGAGKARVLHLGWQLLCIEPDRTSGSGERRRLFAHRVGALQQGGGSGSLSGRHTGDSTVIKTETSGRVTMREEFRGSRVDLAAVL